MNGRIGYHGLGRNFLLNDRDDRLGYGLFGLLNFRRLRLYDRHDCFNFRLHCHRLFNRLDCLDRPADLVLYNRRDLLGLSGGRNGRTRRRFRRFLGRRDFSRTRFMNLLWLDQCDVPREHFLWHDRFDLCHEPDGHSQGKTVNDRGHRPSLKPILPIYIHHRVITIGANVCSALDRSFFPPSTAHSYA